MPGSTGVSRGCLLQSQMGGAESTADPAPPLCTWTHVKLLPSEVCLRALSRLHQSEVNIARPEFIEVEQANERSDLPQEETH